MTSREHRIRNLLLENQPERSPEFWPWLGPLKGKRATKRQANKFLLGCMVDYRKNSDLVWRDVRIYAERTLCDPEDLWNEITKTPEDEWKSSAHHVRCSLHPVRNRHEKIWDMASRIINQYDGDARKIWENQDSAETLRRLMRLGLGPWLSRMTVGGLIDSNQISGRADLKADTHTRRVLGRIFEGEKASEQAAFGYANAMIPGDSWQLDFSLYMLGKDVCSPRNPKCESCFLIDECHYANASG